MWAFVCAAYACSPRGEPADPWADVDDAQAREWLAEESLAPLWSGRLLVRYEAAAKSVMRLIDALEENDDVQDVYANFDIPDRVLEAVAG